MKPRMRALIVEDDRVVQTLLEHRLTREGFEVKLFADGIDAFEWASAEAFDVAILDVKLPGMDGFELLEKLRKIPHAQDVPVLMLTNMASEPDAIRGLELGADDYIRKPFSPRELIARISRLVDRELEE